MDRRGLLLSIALGLVPALVLVMGAESVVSRLSGFGANAGVVAIATLAPAVTNTPTSLATATVTQTPIPPYVPVPTAVFGDASPAGQAERQVAQPTATATSTPTATATVTPTKSATPTIAATATIAATTTSTATPSPTATRVISDFVVIGKEEQCDSTSPANYAGDLVSGQVLDLNGGPMQGIRVRVKSIYASTQWSAEATTDSAGYFRFYLSKGNFEARVVSGTSEAASELWTRSAAEAGVCRWYVTFQKSRP